MKKKLLFVAYFLFSGLLMAQPQLVSELQDRPANFTPFGAGEDLYFSIKDQLWHSGGTQANTDLVIDLGENIVSIQADDENLYIITQNAGLKYYKSDGTAVGTILQPNDNDFPIPPADNGKFELNGYTYFISGDSLVRISSPGSATEVILVDDDFADNGDGVNDNGFKFVRILGVLSSNLIFVTGFHEMTTGDDVLKVYSTNGSVDDTTFLKKIAPGYSIALAEYYKGKILFVPSNESAADYPIWITDGTAGGTIQLSDPVFLDPNGVEYTVIGGKGVFIFDSQSGSRYFTQTDGTPENTFHFLMIEAYYSTYRGIVGIGQTMFYISETDEDDPSDMISDYGLFQMDINDVIPHQVKDLTSDPSDSYVWTNNLTNVNGVLYFSTGDLTIDQTPKLWKYCQPFLTEDITSIAEMSDVHVAAFPNPFNDNLQLQNCDGKSVTLKNSLGAIIHQEKNYSGFINLSHLPTGIYFVGVEGQSDVMKVVKK